MPPNRQSRSVANVKVLGLFFIIRINDSALSQHAVHVENKQFNPGTTLAQGLAQTHEESSVRTLMSFYATCVIVSSAGKRPMRSVMSITPTGRPAESTTGSSLIFLKRMTSTASATRLSRGRVMGL